MKTEREVFGGPPGTSYDVERWRDDFPILRQRLNGKARSISTTPPPPTNHRPFSTRRLAITPMTTPTCTGVYIR